MAEATAKPRDPLRNYQFTIYLQTSGRQWQRVGGVQRVSGLTCTVSAFEVWEGGNNLHRYANPDKVTWDPLTLEQGLALDQTLEIWAAAVRYFSMNGKVMPDKDTGISVPVKRNVLIEVWDSVNMKGPAAQPDPPPRVRQYRVQNAWISKYNALPKLDALASEVALISVELIHEGWTVEFLNQETQSGQAPASP